VGLSTDSPSSLVTFGVNTPGSAQTAAITFPMAATDTDLVGLDYRPRSNQLYAYGRTGTLHVLTPPAMAGGAWTGGLAALLGAAVFAGTQIEGDELPILPKGEYYELWFVGPGDRPGRVNRISAGTFHPDAQGRSNVRFAAAVDPAKYPGLAVTEEPGDGDPAPSRPDVMRSAQP
jgi:hypothetical protein